MTETPVINVAKKRVRNERCAIAEIVTLFIRNKSREKSERKRNERRAIAEVVTLSYTTEREREKE